MSTPDASGIDFEAQDTDDLMGAAVEAEMKAHRLRTLILEDPDPRLNQEFWVRVSIGLAEGYDPGPQNV